MYEQLNKYFDKIYIISVKDHPRFNRMIKRFEGLNYEIFYGIDVSNLNKTFYTEKGSKLTRGQLGCTISHVELYKKIVDEPYDRILILEDDCIFNENIKNFEKYLHQIPSEWDLLYLGWDGVNMYPNYSANISKICKENIVSIHCTHSIAISKKLAKKCIEYNSNYEFTADGLMTHVVSNTDFCAYMFLPKMSYQEGIDCISEEMDKKYGF